VKVKDVLSGEAKEEIEEFEALMRDYRAWKKRVDAFMRKYGILQDK